MSSDVQEAPPETRRRAPGPRTLRRKHHERAGRRRRIRNYLLMLIGLILIVAAATQLRLPLGRNSPNEQAAGGRSEPVQQTWLAIGTVEADPSGEASWLSVISWDRKANRGFVMYVPRTTLVEIPGYGGGPEVAGKALALGKEPLMVSAISNLLGVGFDAPVKISDQAVRALLDKVGGIDVEVSQKLTQRDPDGKVRSVFAEGAQHLDGARTAEYLAFIEETGDEIARGARHSQVWSAVFEKFRANGGGPGFEKVLTESKDLFVTSADPARVAPFLAKFASVGADSVIFETLPAQAEGVDTGTQFYKPQIESIQRTVGRYLADSRPRGAGQPGRKVQILNGNGRPGVGEGVAKRIVPKGFRVVLDANARSFDYETTQIVVYSDSKQALSIGRELRDALGVGEIVLSRQRQTVVDVTVVVGKDYKEG